MACSSCGTSGGGRSSTSCSCKNMKSMDVKTPADKIANGDESFCFKEVTDKICKNLANDEGINPSVNHSNTDCEDLSALNDLGIGKLNNSLIPLNLCDVEALKEWLLCLLSWTWNINKAIVCAICGLWEKVKQLLNTDVGDHLSISSDKNTLTLSRKKLNGTAVASDNIPVGIGDINNNLNKLNNTDVGDHLSISSDKNTLTLSRKKLNGTAVASDNIPVGIGDINNNLNKLNNTDVGDHFSSLVAGGGNYSHTITGTLTRKKLDGSVQASDVKTATLNLSYIKTAIDKLNDKIAPPTPQMAGNFLISNLANDTQMPYNNNPMRLLINVTNSDLSAGMHKITGTATDAGKTASWSADIIINSSGAGVTQAMVSYPATWTGIVSFQWGSVSKNGKTIFSSEQLNKENVEQITQANGNWMGVSSKTKEVRNEL